MQFGFEHLGLNRICGYHMVRNPVSGRVLAKLGMKREGLLRQHVRKNEVFEARVEDSLAGPIFVIDYPAAICPLTKRKASNPAIAERFGAKRQIERVE